MAATEEYLVLRLPVEDARMVHMAIAKKELGDRLKINLHGAEKTRACRVSFDRKDYNATLVDLPTINEVLKTKDDKTFCKLGDLSKMVVCRPKEQSASSALHVDSSGEATVTAAASAKGATKDVPIRWPHGLTPPLKNVRTKRFRKTAVLKVQEQNPDEMERIDREVKRLLQLDRLCKETTGKDVFWEEVYEGGVHPALKTDVAQMSDLDDFAAEDENVPAPDKSAAGFDSSDEDDDKAARPGVGDTASVAADDLDETQSVTSTGTAGTALSAVTGLSATTAPTGAANQPDAWEALDESGDSDVDMTPSSKQHTSSDSNVLLMTSDGGGVNDPLSLDTPLPQSVDTLDTPLPDVGTRPSFPGFDGVLEEKQDNSNSGLKADDTIGKSDSLDLQTEDQAGRTVHEQDGNFLSSDGGPMLRMESNPDTPTSQPIEYAVTSEAPVVTITSAVPAATSSDACSEPAVGSVDMELAGKLAELDAQIAEQTKKVDATKNPKLKKRFEEKRQKLIEERDQVASTQ